MSDDRTNTRLDAFALTPWRVLCMAALLIVTILAYLPAIGGGFIWDDDSYVTENELLHDMEGLLQIWVPSHTPQYYPLVFSTFWIEYQLWELEPMGYHITNVLLHAFSAVLLWVVMVRLRVPAAWLIAWVFALHPVMVESVAWITERKNVLSMFFYLLAALAYLRFDELCFDRKQIGSDQPSGTVLYSHTSGWYGAALLCFIAALLSKTVTCSLPAALILVMVWLRIPLSVRRISPLIPFFIIGFVLAMNTAILEREHVGAVGEDFAYSFLERTIIACHALLFYPWKLLWPAELMFIYPRWEIDASNPLQYLPVLACIAIGAVCLWALSRGWRGPFVALSFYAGTVFPAIGYFNVYPHLFSFVADHFVYHASLGVLAFVIGGAAYLVRREPTLPITAAVLLPVLFALTWMQSTVYESEETVYRDTIAKNPDAWMPHNNLAGILLRRSESHMIRGETEQMRTTALEALHHIDEALRIRSDHHPALANRSEALRLLGRHREALEAIRRAQENAPFIMDYVWKEGRLHELLGDPANAADSYRHVLKEVPENLAVRSDYLRVLLRADRLDTAADVARQTLRHYPDHAMTLASLATIQESRGEYDDADRLYRRAIDAAASLEEYARIVPRAVRFWLAPPDPEYLNLDLAHRHAVTLVEAVHGRDPGALAILAEVTAAQSRAEEARELALRAVALAREIGLDDMAERLEQELQSILQDDRHWPSPMPP